MTSDASRTFYRRWAGVYDVLARRTPGVGSLRRAAVRALDPDPGDTVLDLGCGTGANVPYLRDAVGPDGTVVGVDFTRPALVRAGDQASAAYVHVVQGDVTALPVDGPVDCVFAAFLSGMLLEPAATVEGWTECLAPDGRICLLDAALSDRRGAWPANQVVKALVASSAPDKRDVTRRPWETVTERVTAAHDAVRVHTSDTTERRRFRGTTRITAGTRHSS